MPTRYVAPAATHALALLMSKFRAIEGMPFDVNARLYNTKVLSVISYGAAIWGTREYAVINAVHYWACRFLLGIGK